MQRNRGISLHPKALLQRYEALQSRNQVPPNQRREGFSPPDGLLLKHRGTLLQRYGALLRRQGALLKR